MASRRKCYRLIKWFLDVQIVFIVLTVTLFSYVGWFPVNKQGFYCDDATIRYAFRGDTIKLSVLLSMAAIIPIALIMFVEFWRHWPVEDDDQPRKDDVDPKSSSAATTADALQDSRLCSYRRCCVDVYKIYFYGGICSLAIVEFLKIVVGELRPHFLDTCKPDFSKVNCSDGYITEYTCMGTGPVYYLMDAYKSFPSGHACVSVYMSLFLCVYIRKQVFPHPTYLSSSMLQAMLVIWAVYCSMSRIIDRRHHWWDVVAGLLIGIICAYYSGVNWLLIKPPICHVRSVLTSDSLGNSSLRRDAQGTSRRHYGACDDIDVKIGATALDSFPISETLDTPSFDIITTGSDDHSYRPVGMVNHVGN